MKKFKKIGVLLFCTLLSIVWIPLNNVHADTVVTGEDIVSFAKQQLHKPYVWNSKGPNSFDCSGLVQYVFAHYGISVQAPTTSQVNLGTAVSKENLQPGDLVFFDNTYNGPNPTHVGIYAGDNQFIAAGSAGVNYYDLNSTYWSQHYDTARRIVSAISTPVSPWANQVNSSTTPLLSNCIVSPAPYSTLACKSEPSNSSITNGTLNAGQTVNIYAKSGDWFLVNRVNRQWVSAEYIKIPSMSPIATGAVATSSATCRQNPSSTELDTGNISYGGPVNIYEEYNGYYLVNSSTNLQWISVSSIKITSMPNVPTANSSSTPIKTYDAPAGTKCYSFPRANINNLNGTIDTVRTLNVYAVSNDGCWYLVNKVNPQWIQVK